MYLTASEFSEDNILTEWNGEKGRFLKTFGINNKRNKNEWRAPWNGIVEHSKTAIGMPGIAYEKCVEGKCGLDHVEADTFKETVEKQKPFKVTEIKSFILNEDKSQVDFIHEVVDDDFWDKVKSGKIKYVSPMIWPATGGYDIVGVGRDNIPQIDAFHWQFVHHAFLEENPAFGKDANISAMCEGENCQVKLLSAKEVKDAKLFGDIIEKTISCGTCKHFIEGGRCQLVQGAIDELAICDLYNKGDLLPADTTANPKYTKYETNYNFALSSTKRKGKLFADISEANAENLSHLQEIPLLIRHKGKLHFVSASTCVQNIIKKKKDDGIEIDDQALAIAYSECGESAGLKSSFKTCTCDSEHNMSVELLQAQVEETQKEKKDLEAKLKSMEDNEHKEANYKSKRAKYGKLFANMEEHDREDMIAKFKAAMDDDEHDKMDMKAMEEEHEEMKSKKGMEHGTDKEKELEATLKAMQAKEIPGMISGLIALRKANCASKEELTNYHKALQGKSYLTLQSDFTENQPAITRLAAKSENTTGTSFDFENTDYTGSALAAKTLNETFGDSD